MIAYSVLTPPASCRVSKTTIAGWIIFLFGCAFWLYGYLVVGHPSLIDWQAHTPWWIADYLPNLEIRERNVTLNRQHGADVLADFRKQIVLSLDAQLPLPAPAKQTQHAKSGSEERECGWEWDL